MAPKRYSIYNSPALDRALSERIKPDSDEGDFRSRSSMISAMADRYAEIIRRSMPSLMVDEWMLIFDVMNGCWTMDQPYLQAQGIAHQIADATEMDNAGEKWAVDGLDLARRIAAMTFSEQLAILDTAERFWSLGVLEGETQYEIVMRLARVVLDEDPAARKRAKS